MSKKLTNSKKQSLLNKADNIQGKLIDLCTKMREAGINVDIYSQQAGQSVRKLQDLIERS